MCLHQVMWSPEGSGEDGQVGLLRHDKGPALWELAALLQSSRIKRCRCHAALVCLSGLVLGTVLDRQLQWFKVESQELTACREAV